MPATKSFRSGTWASTLLPISRSAALRATGLGGLLAEEPDTRRHALSIATRPRSGRLDTEHRDALRDEVLQQVAVVAGELDD